MPHPTIESSSPRKRSFAISSSGAAAVALLAMLSSGCESRPDPTPAATPAPEPSPSSAAVGSGGAASKDSQSSGTSRTLCLADPGGGTAVDGEVRAAQLWVQRLPRSTDKLVELGRAWVAKARHTGDPGHYLNARACAEMVLEREPRSHLAREILAQVALNQHEFLAATDLCREVLHEDPESLVALAVQADALYELGRIEEAVDATSALVGLKPDLASYMRVSFLAWIKGDLDGALRSARLAIKAGNDPAKPEPRAYAMVQTANYFFQKGDYAGADEGYKQAASSFADYPPALVGRGKVALAMGDARRAAELLHIAYKQSPLAETAWRLGDARALAGDQAGADEAYSWVVKIGRAGDPRTLAQFYATKNREPDEALRLAEAEMKVRPGIYTEDTLAWALYRKGRLDEARAASDRARRAGTRDPVLIYHAGAIRVASGQREEGEKLIREALALSPRFDVTAAAEAEALLRHEM